MDVLRVNCRILALVLLSMLVMFLLAGGTNPDLVFLT